MPADADPPIHDESSPSPEKDHLLRVVGGESYLGFPCIKFRLCSE